MAPAMRAALRAPCPRVADTVSTCWGFIVTGSEPYFRAVARSLADWLLKLPEIWIWLRVKLGLLIVGAEMTEPSNTMPSCLVGQVASPWKHFAAAALNRSMPSAPALNVGLTIHWPCWFTPALAVSTARPESRLGPSWYRGVTFWPFWSTSVPERITVAPAWSSSGFVVSRADCDLACSNAYNVRRLVT